ncbi:MAG: hypothetical protein K6G32_11380 [Prevotella sp.]|nr:hypothetical protein [Prevotella sp.]
MENLTQYIVALVAIIIAFVIIKKVASCLIRTVVGIVLVAVLAYIYIMYMQ